MSGTLWDRLKRCFPNISRRVGIDGLRSHSWILSLLVLPGCLYSVIILLMLLSSGFSPKPTDLTDEGHPYVTHNGVYQERLKIFDFVTHYPGTNDNETAYIFSWYLAYGCVRPANQSKALPSMCHHHPPWQSIDVPGLLAMVDTLNGGLPDATNTNNPSETSVLVLKAIANLSAGGVVWLLSWGMALNIIGSFSFWNLSISSKLIYCLIPLGVAAVFHFAAGFWLHSMAHAAKSQILSVNSKYANDPKIGWEFWLLYWSAIATTILCFLCALAQLSEQLKRKTRTWIRKPKVNVGGTPSDLPPSHDPPAYESLNFGSNEDDELYHQTEVSRTRSQPSSFFQRLVWRR